MRIAISGEARGDPARIRSVIRRALKPYGLPRDTELHVAFVTDAEMRAMNKRFRNIDRTTDVLSFGEDFPSGVKGNAAIPYIEAHRSRSGGRFDLGEIMISVEQASRQARRRRKPVADEITFLAAHGSLHLLGFEDETPAGYREMVRLGRAAVAGRS